MAKATMPQAEAPTRNSESGALNTLTTTNFNVPDPASEHASRLTELEAGTEIALALIATAVYWGDETTDNWWFGDIERFASPTKLCGYTGLCPRVYQSGQSDRRGLVPRGRAPGVQS